MSVEVSSSSTVPSPCVTASVRSSGLTAMPRGDGSSTSNRLASGTPRTSRRPSGENVNVVLRGAITLYHDEACTQGVTYGPGSTFTTSPDEVHLARNETGEELVVFATYFAPRTSPSLPVRIDQASPGAACPQ